jgi:Uma2 family endonuclease
MDTHAIPSTQRRTTRGAEGLDRWRWTTAELVSLRAAGAFTDQDRFELIDGEIVPMAADGRRHAILADRIAAAWVTRDPRHLRVGEEKQLNLDDATYTKPDVLVWPAGIEIPDVRGPDVLLLVEVADSSLDKDLSIKRDLYARFGVREYWVIDATTLATMVHGDPHNGRYAAITRHAPDETLIAELAPAMTVRLADFASKLR